MEERAREMEKRKNKRISVSLSKSMEDRLNGLVKQGIYLDPQNAMRDALRRLFILHGMGPLYEYRIGEAE